ncbi:MAG: hypothetical protein JXR76_30515 [Deltaproteobacteria bacterium]|nr:hypothetical protein [Deltaproteobacteria bacterium]
MRLSYDAFIPDYLSKDGFEGNVENLHAFLKEHHIDEMYYSCDKSGDDLIHFFESGKFTPHARRRRFIANPFE